jgi:two-component system cell cycle sensor histidine kinase/response regulator CckA
MGAEHIHSATHNKRSETLTCSLVENCPFGIVRANLATNLIEQANPVVFDVLGYSRDELFCLPLPELYVDPADRERLLAEMHANGNATEFETRFRKKNGEVVCVAYSGQLGTDAETGQPFTQGYLVDITHHRELEEQLNHSQRMDAVGRLAGGVAHDFNNIMQSISLSCELALQSQLAPALESKLLDIMQQAGRAADITRQLLAFSRKQVLQPRALNINTCARNAFSMISRIVSVDISVDLQLQENLAPVFIDPDQLTIVLMHLASNARDAMPNGGQLRIATTASPENSSHRIFPEPCVVLTVTDTLDRIFEPFFSTRETALASGLGLSTVHGIIAQSKGSIECESKLGQGTTFRICLPIAQTDSANSGGAKTNPQSHRLLLAEDDPTVNEALTNTLIKAGFRVDSVRDGEQALARFQKEPYDLVITDIVMPKIDGVELTRSLRQRDPSLPVVLISGYNEETSLIPHLAQSHLAYLQKPFPGSLLVATIRRLLSLRK